MKWALRNKTAEKRLKMAIFKLLVLSYICTLPYIFLSFQIRKNDAHNAFLLNVLSSHFNINGKEIFLSIN